MLTFPKYFTANFVAWALSQKMLDPLDLGQFQWYSVHRRLDNKIHYRLNGAPLLMKGNGHPVEQVRAFRQIKNEFHQFVDKRYLLDFGVSTSRLDARFPIYTNVSEWRHCTDGDAAVRDAMYQFYHDKKPRMRL